MPSIFGRTLRCLFRTKTADTRHSGRSAHRDRPRDHDASHANGREVAASLKQLRGPRRVHKHGFPCLVKHRARHEDMRASRQSLMYSYSSYQLEFIGVSRSSHIVPGPFWRLIYWTQEVCKRGNSPVGLSGCCSPFVRNIYSLQSKNRHWGAQSSGQECRQLLEKQTNKLRDP